MIFGLLLVLFGVFTAILRYHWKHFDFTHSPGVVRAQIIYYAGSLLFIAGMIISLLSL